MSEKKKRAKRPNYTQKTLAKLEKDGALAGVCEKWIAIPSFPGGRDLFGLFDIIAIRAGKIVGIQSTSRVHKADHAQKMFENENLEPWLKAGALAEIWLWQKKPMGGNAGRHTYELDVQSIRLWA